MEENVASFPFPFQNDTYHYSNNSTPLDPPYSINVTTEYLEEIKLKRSLLEHHHQRCFQSLPGTLEAQWETAELILEQLADVYPDQFRLEKDNHKWTFVNRLTNETQSFVFGDSSTLPWEPLDFAGRHVQEDLLLLMQKDGELYLEAGQLCFPGRWSLVFKMGMTFLELHQPIPKFRDKGLADKIRTFLLRIDAGNPFQRLNWSLTAGHHLDTAMETSNEWGRRIDKLTPANIGSLLHLRVEHQKLLRLPKSNAVLFTIHTHLLPLEKLAENEAWLTRFHRVFTTLPDHILTYKGASPYKDMLIDYLEDLQKIH